MKYSSLKNDIINILHSSDYNLYLKLYDQVGNTTLNTDDVEWCYINNYNVMIEFMVDDEPTLTILKDNKSTSDVFKTIIQQIREICILNGVDVQIKMYNDLNQRKLYNFIKTNIINQKQDENMNESHKSNSLEETLYGMINIAKNANKPSDFYLSEEMISKNHYLILNEMIQELKSLKKIKKLNESFNTILTANSFQDIQNYVSSLPIQIKNKLNESIDDIKNISSFVKGKYLNNLITSNEKQDGIKFMSNTKLYIVSESLSKVNKAYNQLLSNPIKNELDISRYIKQNKLCETYNVSKDEIINEWFKHNGLPILSKKSYIIECSNGEKYSFDESLKVGILPIMNYINNGGSKDDLICQNIISETKKYNEISSFLKEYHDSYKMNSYIKTFKKMLKECAKKLSSNYNIFNYVNEPIDYSLELKNLQDSLNCKHTALKYIAINEAQQRILLSKILIENRTNDLNILQKYLKPYTKSLNELQSLIESIMSKNIHIKVSLNESKTIKSKIEEVFNTIRLSDNKNEQIIASSLFNIMESKLPLSNEKRAYINRLFFYIL